MAFDVTNAAHLLALKNEVLTDPVGMGYNATGATQDILDLLNDPANNVGAETGADTVTPENFIKSIWGQSVSSQDQFKVNLLMASVTSLESDISRFKTELSALSGGIATAIAGITRPLSRAEVLFSNLDENGVNESVTILRQDWIIARES